MLLRCLLTPLPSLAVLTLQELCCRAIVARTTVYNIDQLPLPAALRGYLKSYAECGYKTLRPQRTGSQRHRHRKKIITPQTYRPPRAPLSSMLLGGRSCVLM